MATAFETVEKEVMSWPRVISGTHRFGGTAFRVSGREMGHMHGSSWTDLPFPMNERNELVEKGAASPHHVLPKSGWVTFYIRSDDEVPALMELFRKQYNRLKH